MWLRHSDPNNVKRTVDLIKTISKQYGTPAYADTVTMIELLNEPTLWISNSMKSVTRQYYFDRYEAARRPWSTSAGNKTDWIVIFNDGFKRWIAGTTYDWGWI